MHSAMRSRNTWRTATAATAALLLCLAHLRGWFEPGERAFQDALLARRSPAPEEARGTGIAVVEITDDGMERFGTWPWRRSLVAELLEHVARARPRALAVDLLFLDPDPAEDARLVEVLEQAGNVVLAAEVVRRTSWDNALGGLVTRLEVARPPAPLRRAAAGLGLVNVDYFHDNQDGVVRKLPLFGAVGGERLPVLALQAVALGTSRELRRDPGGSWTLGGELLPVDPPRPTHERRGGPRGELLEVEFPESVYVGYQPDAGQGGLPTVRAVDVLDGEVSPARFRDRVVFVGLNAQGLDRKVTPVGSMPGVEVQAQLARSLLEGRVVRRMGPWTSRACMALALLLGVLAAARLSGPGALVAGGALGGAWWFGAGAAFEATHLLLDVYAPLFGLGVGLAAGKLTDLTLDVRDHIRRLVALHESSRRFSRTLDFGQLEAAVRERYSELLGGAPVALAFRLGEEEALRYGADSELDPALRAALGHPRVQRELVDLLRVPDGAVPGARLREIRDLPAALEVPEVAVVLPLGRFEEARGFVFCASPARPVSGEGDEGRFWSTHANVAATALENAGLYRLATVDALTGLYIRHYFDVALRRELARVGRHRGQVALLLTDIDHFKAFNDTHGHQVGDRVLRFVADQVRATVRDVDIACRYGGEEFAVVLPDTDVEGARQTAERIRSTLEQASVEVEGEELSVTLSIGLAWTDGGEGRPGPEAFVQRADKALYRAKEAGRNRVEVSRPEPREREEEA